jgi:hypothetical protein
VDTPGSTTLWAVAAASLATAPLPAFGDVAQAILAVVATGTPAASTPTTSLSLPPAPSVSETSPFARPAAYLASAPIISVTTTIASTDAVNASWPLADGCTPMTPFPP